MSTSAVVDVASRRVLAHKVAITLDVCHAREVINAVFARHGIYALQDTPEIVNTDQGSLQHGQIAFESE